MLNEEYCYHQPPNPDSPPPTPGDLPPDSVPDEGISLIRQVMRSEKYADPDEDGGSEQRWDLVLLEVGAATPVQIRDYILDEFPAERCMHDYDCCAHWYQNHPKWERSGKFVLVTLGYTQNV